MPAVAPSKKNYDALTRVNCIVNVFPTKCIFQPVVQALAQAIPDNLLKHLLNFPQFFSTALEFLKIGLLAFDKLAFFLTPSHLA